MQNNEKLCFQKIQAKSNDFACDNKYIKDCGTDKIALKRNKSDGKICNYPYAEIACENFSDLTHDFENFKIDNVGIYHEQIKKLKAIRAESVRNGIPVLREQTFNFLINEIRRINPNNILEIGTATGCSAIAMLLNAPNAKLTTIEIDEQSYLAAKKNFETFSLNERTVRFIADAADVIPKLSGSFDFIFLDGPKGHYLEYYPYLKDLLCEKGEMFCDNVLFRGYVIDKPKGRKYNAIINNMRRFIKTVQEDDEVFSKLFEIEDGVLLINKK